MKIKRAKRGTRDGESNGSSAKLRPVVMADAEPTFRRVTSANAGRSEPGKQERR